MFNKILIILFLIFTLSIFAQSDLNVFGFFQTRYQSITTDDDFGFVDENTFQIQQLNLMASKDLGYGFSAFVNFELINDFDALRDLGNFNLQEAFVNYSNSDGSFQVKVGRFLPRFNNLYEIYNRTPLLPYAYRPLVYERQLSNIFDFEGWLPALGNAQIYGAIPVTSTLDLDYAVWVGNLESSFQDDFRTDFSSDINAGNARTAVSVGGRLGINYSDIDAGDLKLGFSFVSDYDNNSGITSYFGPIVVQPVIDLINGGAQAFGDTEFSVSEESMNQDISFVKTDDNGKFLYDGNQLHRYKLGVDASYSNFGVTLSGEYMQSMYNFTDFQEQRIGEELANFNKANQYYQASLSQLPAEVQAQLPSELFGFMAESWDKSFWFATFQYDLDYSFEIPVFAYGMTSTITSDNTFSIKDGLTNYSFGLGWNANSSVVVKGQYSTFELTSVGGDYKDGNVMFAVSVMF